jgi:DNA-binding CsgD family transcriptional regulator
MAILGLKRPMMAGRASLVDQAVAALEANGTVLLTGEAGVGKSTVLRAVRERLEPLVLSASPAPADARLPYVTLIDLFASLPDECFTRLTAASRRALDTALRRRDTTGEVDTLGVCLGVLELLRTLGADGPVVLVIDDVQWVDASSQEVLQFWLRRRGPEPVRVIGAERVSRGRATERWMPPDTTVLEVAPLRPAVLAPVVMQRAPGLISSAVARKICDASLGNPLFALEIADAVRRQGVAPTLGEPLPLPMSVDALMRQRLAGLTESARDTVRLAAAAHRPTASLLARAGCADVMGDLEAASAAGICELAGSGEVTFGHPLMREAVQAEAPAIAWMRAHARLAGVVGDPIDRARHLALSTVVEDEAVASALEHAAGLARKRGAPAMARELAGVAAQRTAAGDVPVWSRRTIDAAWFAYAAGQAEDARALAEQVLATPDVPRALRVRAWLAMFESAGNAIGQLGEQVNEALADAAGDDQLEVWVRNQLVVHHTAAQRFDEAMHEGEWVARTAAALGDARSELSALYSLLIVYERLGLERGPTLARALDLLDTHTDLGDIGYLIHIQVATLDMERDKYGSARAALERALEMAEQTGTQADVGYVLFQLARVETKLGHCAEVSQIIQRLDALPAGAGQQYANFVLRTRAEAEAIGGDFRAAVDLAEQAVAASKRIGDEESLMPFCQLLGTCRLFAGDTAGAVAALSEAREHGRGRSTGSARVRYLLADLVEAYVRVGDVVTARSVLDELTASQTPTTAPGILAATKRAEAHVLGATGAPDEAAAGFAEAAATYRVLEMPIELVRTQLVAAEVERRQRRRAAARLLLEEAMAAARQAGATPWVGRVQADLERLAPTREPEGRSLTPMEARIAGLAAQGCTNREIATTLKIAVSTVESSLTNIYRKLGVRSRIGLVTANVSAR